MERGLTATPQIEGGARWRKSLAGKQDRSARIPSFAKNGGNALLHLVLNVAQRWSKVAQQGGRCSTLKVYPFQGDKPWREVEQSPGPFAGVEQTA